MRPLNSVLKSCIYEVSTNHCRAVKSGTIQDIYTANFTISGYRRCGLLGLARKVFDEMPRRDTVSWNSMISGYVNSGDCGVALNVFGDMRRCGLLVDGFTFGSVFKGVAGICEIDIGEQLHSVAIKMGCIDDVFTGSAILDMYAKCHKIDEATLVFERMKERNSVSWNALIAGNVEMGNRDAAIQLLMCMEEEGVKIEDGTLAPLLTLLNEPEFYWVTVQIHGKVIKSGLGSNNFVCNAIMTSYSECGSLEDAKKVFYDAVDVHDLVTWNSMLAAYLEHNEESLAFLLFLDMQELGFEPDIYTYTSVVSACFEEVRHRQGRSLHGLIVKRGLEVSTAISNALIAMYLKSNGKSMEDAVKLFELIEWKDSVSWNSVLTGFSQLGLSEDALKFFEQMRSQDVGIDHYSFSAVLRSCSDLAALCLGQQVHVLALMSGLESNEHVAGSLIFMYSKCGLIDDALKSFEDTPKDSRVTWNSIIFAYAQHGRGDVALQLFHQMGENKVKLDHITFVAVLTACSHMGFVEEGRYFLKNMECKYGIPLRMEHYACGIDLFGRAGLLDETKELVQSMPFEPDAMVLKTLLGACRNCGDVELANEVASRLLEVEPEEHCTYIILSDMYGRLKQWDEKASLTKLMKERGVKKVPGWSWIEINNEAHSFNAEDTSNPESKAVYDTLNGIMEEIRMLRFASCSEFCIPDMNESHGS